MSFLDRIAACAVLDPGDFLPFLIDDTAVGFVRPAFAARLAGFPRVFACDSAAIRLAAGLGDAPGRTAAVHDVLLRLREDGVFSGWRDEPYPLFSPVTGEVLMTIERAAVPRFGIVATGVHLNGIVAGAAGMEMWIGRRGLDRPMAPGKLDQIVAGGRAAGHGVLDTLIKEASEEAGIPPALAAHARPTGVITYATERDEGLRRDVLFVYDLALPADFVPVNHDGEIAEFMRWPIDRVAAVVAETDDFKFNCALVVIDFLMRHGLLAADSPDYVRLAEGLRAGAAATLRLRHAGAGSPPPR